MNTPDKDDVVERLAAIVNHDWRVSHLAHTSDTAKEARAEIERLTRRVAELELVLTNTAMTLEDRASDYEAMLRGASYRNTLNGHWDDDKPKAVAMICADLTEMEKYARSALNPQGKQDEG